MKRNAISTDGRVAELVAALVADGWGFERRATSHGMLRDPAGRFAASIPLTTANLSAYLNVRSLVRRHCRTHAMAEPAAVRANVKKER